MHKFSTSTTLITLFFITAISGLSRAEEHNLVLDPDLIALDGPEGEKLLDESKAKKSYLPLSIYFTTQDTPTYCGVASICMVLNASHIERPVSQEHQPYRIFNQRNIFNERVASVAKVDQIKRSGMPLKTLGAIFATYSLRTEVVYAEDTTLEGFRERAASLLQRVRSFLW